ncbi:MAG: hypothetical protein HQK76_08385 [Desulfobacterales bacterium]|nr:hypothetical protein [Desulfobacterales bacterium]
MEQNLSTFQKYYEYSKERFPILPAMLYSGAIYYVAYCFGNLFLSKQKASIIQSLLGFIVIFLSMFALRIFDEHKDYDRDIVAHPDRLLSKGVITLSDLRKLLYGILCLEFLITIYLGFTQFVILIIILIWSLLMLVEFFAKEFLNNNMTLYLISHQLIVPIILLFGFSQRFDISNFKISEIISFIIFSLGVVGCTVTYEIARKTWSKDREHKDADSYTKVWGIPKTIMVNQIIALLSAIIFIYFYLANNLNTTYFVIILSVYFLFLASEIIFLLNPDSKKSKIVEVAGALYVIILLLNSSFAFGLK